MRRNVDAIKTGIATTSHRPSDVTETSQLHQHERCLALSSRIVAAQFDKRRPRIAIIFVVCFPGSRQHAAV